MDRSEAFPDGLHGHTGQAPSYTLPDGSSLSAAEVTGLAFKAWCSEYEESDPPTPAEWNALEDSARRGYCNQALTELADAQRRSAELVDQANVLDTVGEDAALLLGEALINAALTEVKALEKPWQMLSEDAQRDVLERITNQVKEATRDTIRLLATAGAHHIVCELDSITVKKGAKANLVIPKGELDQDLLDAVGQQVILVIGPELKAASDIQAPRPDPTQRELLEGVRISPQDSGLAEPGEE